METCKICGDETVVLFTQQILGRYPTDYSRCRSCGFITTGDPHWLPEAYSSAISDADLGAVNRAITLAPTVERVLLKLFNPHRPCVDYGAGYGVLVRMMRDRGYDFRWQDLYADNLFAKGLEADPTIRYELLTAFEVLEHLPDPVAELGTMLEFSDNLLVTTEIIPESVGPRWWYFGPQHGQHVAFYTHEALRVLAERFGLHVHHAGSLHLMSRVTIAPRRFKHIAQQQAAARGLRQAMRRRRGIRALLEADHEQANSRLVAEQATEAPRPS